MKKGLIAIGAVILVVIILVIAGFSQYNGLVKADISVDESWAQVENQLKRRADLVPDLVKVANKYAIHEKDVIQNVSDARAKMAGAATSDEAIVAARELDSTLSRLLVVMEAYPDLKADGTYSKLMDEMAGTENRIAVARKDFNEEVGDFNKKVRTFPGNIIAGWFGFAPHWFYEAPEEDLEKPEYDL